MCKDNLETNNNGTRWTFMDTALVFFYVNFEQLFPYLNVRILLEICCESLLNILACDHPPVNQFLINVLILYTLKTPENQRFPSVFRGINEKIVQKWVKDVQKIIFKGCDYGRHDFARFRKDYWLKQRRI